jgi:hypothetical protein
MMKRKNGVWDRNVKEKQNLLNSRGSLWLVGEEATGGPALSTCDGKGITREAEYETLYCPTNDLLLAILLNTSPARECCDYYIIDYGKLFIK